MGFANPEQERVSFSPSSLDTVPNGNQLCIDFTFGSSSLTVDGAWQWTTDPAANITLGANSGNTWQPISSYADYLVTATTDAGLCTRLAIGAAFGTGAIDAVISGDLAEVTPGDAGAIELTAFPGSGSVQWTVDLAGVYPAQDKSVITVEVGWGSGREVMTATWAGGTWVQKRHTPRKPR